MKYLVPINCQMNRTSTHSLRRRCQNNFGSKGLEQHPTFHTHTLGHGQFQGISPCRSHHGQSNSGVPGSGLDQNGFTRSDVAALFRFGDHGEGDAVFDTVGWIVAFQLADNFGDAILIDAVEFHQGSVANQIQDRIGDLFFSFGHGKFGSHGANRIARNHQGANASKARNDEKLSQHLEVRLLAARMRESKNPFGKPSAYGVNHRFGAERYLPPRWKDTNLKRAVESPFDVWHTLPVIRQIRESGKVKGKKGL
jgi:hypothetical protein